jgi:hypothetical protein
MQERRGRPCAVTDCGKPVHALSRWCSRHHQASLRYGSPLQERVLRKTTKPYDRIASRLITANRDHPALVLVISELDEMLATAARARAGNAYTPSPQDWQGKMNVDLARLHAAGLTGRDIFRTVTALHFYARAFPRSLPPSTRAYRFIIARHVLNLTHRDRYGGWCVRAKRTGWVERKGSVRLSTRVLDHLGQHLAVTLCPVLAALEPAYDALVLAPTARRQKLAAALAQPFAGPAVAPQTPAEVRAAQLVKDQAELQRLVDARQEAQEKADTDTVPEVELLDPAAEEIMTEAVAKIGNLDAAAAVRSALDTDGMVSEDVTNRIATTLGVPAEQVAERVETLKASFETQARNTIGTGATEVFDYARQFAPKELRQAMLDQVNNGTTKGYAALAKTYMENLADTPEGREIITASPDAQARGVFVEPRTGKLFIEHPKVGRVAWKTAVREGLIKPAHRN